MSYRGKHQTAILRLHVQFLVVAVLQNASSETSKVTRVLPYHTSTLHPVGVDVHVEVKKLHASMAPVLNVTE